ncbi:MAG: ECF transporter S component [Oscillospiraceae bacterium]|nr:ECF transporter S component [Oscillospiraceae bacterium]
MKQKWSVVKLAFIAVLAAVVCVVSEFRFPFLGSKIHLANAMCLLSGLLMGPSAGALAAGLGSALYDALFGGYGLLDCAVTFVTKAAMAWVCATIAFSGGSEAKQRIRNIAACVIGALSYVCLYMLKTFLFQKFLYGYPAETVWATMLSKLPASATNALAAMIVAPILYTALSSALERAGLLRKLRA